MQNGKAQSVDCHEQTTGNEGMNTIQRIPLDAMDLSEETFSVNFRPDLDRLRASIKEVGLIQPVLLRRTGESYQIVCGFRRIMVLKEMGAREVEGNEIEDDDELRLFRLALHDNLATRGLNAVEKAIALDKLMHRFGVDRSALIARFLPLLSLETSEKILDTFLSLARMGDDMKAYVLKEEVSRSNIRKLSRFSEEDRTAILPLISSLKLGENSLRETLTYLEEISQRNRLTLRAVLEDPRIRALLAQEGLTPSQRTERLKRVLMGLRYPRMSEMEERFEKGKRELNLPRDVALNHPPYFEGRGLKAEFQFRTMEEYRSALSFLSHMAEEEPFRELLEGWEKGSSKSGR
jgi:ParB/RepB/Spo0J family partition protein